jgi:hypothetical protein
MDMDMSIVENCLEDTCDLSIYLLYSIETTFGYSSWERWYLIDTDDPLIRDDEEVELVIDPW